MVERMADANWLRAEAGLPFWAIHISHYFYPTHQAWYSNVSITEQTGEDINLHKQTHVEWGPFDHIDDVREWDHLMLEEALGYPGAPWG